MIDYTRRKKKKKERKKEEHKKIYCKLLDNCKSTKKDERGVGEKNPRLVSLLGAQNVTYKQGILHKILSDSNADWENL